MIPPKGWSSSRIRKIAPETARAETDAGNFFSNAAAQRTDRNIWVAFVIF